MKARFIGGLLGLLIASMVVSSTRPTPVTQFQGQIVSECTGSLRAIAIQYCDDAEFTLTAYRQFLRAIPADVRVHVLTPSQREFDAFQESIAPISAQLIPVIANHAMTCWSRDRWVAVRDETTTRLICPQSEDADVVWPARQGDRQVAFDLAKAVNVNVLRSPLYFDGGDLLADQENAFVTPAVARRNLGITVRDTAELEKHLHEQLGRRIVLLNDAPQHHAGMYLASVGQRTAIVGDPRLGRSFLPSIPQKLLAALPQGPDFSGETQARFDRVATQLSQLGYRVIRIPTLCSPDAKTYLTYVNGIMDERAGQKRVFMPMYEGADAMNAAASSVWREAGFEVVPVDCTDVFAHFGTLHCLVNVLERS